jgi:hypothetical protein
MKRFGGPVVSIGRHFDEGGGFLATEVRRDHFMDGEQLVYETSMAVKAVVNAELVRFAKLMGRPDVAEQIRADSGSSEPGDSNPVEGDGT